MQLRTNHRGQAHWWAGEERERWKLRAERGDVAERAATFFACSIRWHSLRYEVFNRQPVLLRK